jgi:hypothetical protein
MLSTIWITRIAGSHCSTKSFSSLSSRPCRNRTHYGWYSLLVADDYNIHPQNRRVCLNLICETPANSSRVKPNMGGAMACPRPYYPHYLYCEPGRGQAIAPPIFRWPRGSFRIFPYYGKCS